MATFQDRRRQHLNMYKAKEEKVEKFTTGGKIILIQVDVSVLMRYRDIYVHVKSRNFGVNTLLRNVLEHRVYMKLFVLSYSGILKR